ncbi:TonB family protein [Burkholderiales bacterium JOSHI_001]|nr:TonB family protein [Burkholderiales bacterium JOSHI_001]
MPTAPPALNAITLADALGQGGGHKAASTRWVALGVLAMHLAGLWALLQVPAVRQAARDAVPLVFSLVTPQPKSEPPPPAPTPLPPPSPVVPARVATAPPRPAPAAPPVLATAPATAFTTALPPAAVLVPQASATAEAAPAPVAAPAPDPAAAPAPAPAAPAPAPRWLPATAVSYLVPPAVEVPLPSRRLGESGTVLLRVLVGTDGRPQRITLHKGSGHARLDEQALWAMAQARFKPQTDNGQPVEWVVIAPLAYELD